MPDQGQSQEPEPGARSIPQVSCVGAIMAAPQGLLWQEAHQEPESGIKPGHSHMGYPYLTCTLTGKILTALRQVWVHM